ncbi:MAG: PEPxxWA-CTERM sorting domain-containing protein, partial [Azoarcus sp.]|nr:PEPxxWA-CTERM sorting domain-containing protein [Azoarcus sp.]
AITVDLKRGASAEKGLYQFSTGDGSLDTTTAASKALLGTPHSAVVYDYKGQSNVAVIGFEDTPRFHLSDYDDFIFTVSNVQQFENPLSPPLPSVPEPETYAMLLAGLGIIGAVARRRRMSGM